VDILRDKGFPVAATTRQQVREFFQRHGVGSPVKNALREAWAEFSAQTTEEQS
jgi:hypothetical protein